MIFPVDTDGTLTTGLVAYYKLENTLDSYGTNHLTNNVGYNGDTDFGAGKINNCAKFQWYTGLSTDHPLLTAHTNFSIAFWMYWQGGNQVGRCYFYNGSNDAKNGWGLSTCTTGFYGGFGWTFMLGIQMGQDEPNAYAFVELPDYTTASWRHIILTNDNGIWRLYHNNSDVGVTQDVAFHVPTVESAIGAFRRGTGLGQWQCQYHDMDEFGVWDKVLSAQERADLYNGGAGQTPTVMSGPTCWGHSSGVSETNTRKFAANWVGTGTIEGSGNSEQMVLAGEEYMESEVINTSGGEIELDQNHYSSGDNGILKWRTGSTEDICIVQSWTTYTGTFTSAGYVQIRVENS